MEFNAKLVPCMLRRVEEVQAGRTCGRAVYPHCKRCCLETLPRADLLNCIGTRQQNCYALLSHRKLGYVPSKYTTKCVLLVICLLPKGQVCYGAVWYKTSVADQYKIKRGRKKRELELLCPCVLTNIAIYVCLI